MANRYAVQAGNWSDTATWNGGTLPGAGDVVRPNTFIVTIDQDVEVALLTNGTSSPAASGGYFDVAAGGITITAHVLGAATQSSNLAVLVINATSGTVTVVGNITAGGSSNQRGLSVFGSGVTLAVQGDVFAVTGTGNTAPGLIVQATCTIMVDGNVVGGVGGSGSAGIDMGSTASTLTVIGDATGGGTSNNPGINATGSCVLDIQGEVIASNAAPGIRSTNASAVIRLSGPLRHAPNNRMSIVAESWMIPSTGNFEWIVNDDSAFPAGGADIHIARWHDNTPPPSDVRAGVEYGPEESITGTMVIPDPGAVVQGVPVDGAVGTAVGISPGEVWDYPLDDADTAGSMGLRLKNTATVPSTGAQIAAALDSPDEGED